MGALQLAWRDSSDQLAFPFPLPVLWGISTSLLNCRMGMTSESRAPCTSHSGCGSEPADGSSDASSCMKASRSSGLLSRISRYNWEASSDRRSRSRSNLASTRFLSASIGRACLDASERTTPSACSLLPAALRASR